MFSYIWRRLGLFHRHHHCRLIVRCISYSPLSVKEKFGWLKDHAPQFGIDGRNVTVLDGPQHFYNALKHGIENASKRVILASLYIGDGPLEKALVDSLLCRCSESKSCGTPINVKVLLDYTRGSRGVTNSRTLLLPLLEDYHKTSQVALYHTPNLRGILRALIPERYNEVIGLSHLKVYLFDNSLVMSGANLSNDYFTNRQDRYILFRDVPEVSNFFCQLVSTISTFSLQLKADNSVKLHPTFQIHPFKGDIKTFKVEASELVKSVINPTQDRSEHHPPPNQDNNSLSNAIKEKFNSLSQSITKQNFISRNFSSLSEEYAGSTTSKEFISYGNDTSTTGKKSVSNNDLDKELRLLHSLEKILTDPHISRCSSLLDDKQININIKSQIYNAKDNVHNESTHGRKQLTQSCQKLSNSCQTVIDRDPKKCNLRVDASNGIPSDHIISSCTADVKFTGVHVMDEVAGGEVKSSQDINKQNTGGQDMDITNTGSEVDTWIYPLIQMGPLGITVDQEVTERLLQTSGEDSTCILASGYFNLVDGYLDLINSSRAGYRILMASPQVNGFYKAKGFPGFIPDAYTFIARKFYNRMKHTGQLTRVKLFEYYKQSWTFHAKGLWLCINGQRLPSLTLVGSPNFGYRSVHRDLEAQVAIVTENHSLQTQLHQEHERLFNQSQPVSEATFDEPDRKEPLWVRLIVPIIKNFF